MTGRLGAILVALFVGAAVLGAVYTPHDPDRPDFRARLAAPTAEHPLGTDHFGRDLLSRLLAGAGTALLVGAAAVALGAGLGVPAGVLAGWRGGLVEEVVMRPVEALAALPAVLLALLLATLLGPGLAAATLAIGLAAVPGFTRLARAATLEQRGRDYVQSARALGAAAPRLVVAHVLPNALGPLAVLGTATFATAILAEAALSYLGLGVQPPAASWGRMLREAQTFLAVSAWPTVVPGLAIALAVLGLNLAGDALRDRLDPRLSGDTGAPVTPRTGLSGAFTGRPVPGDPSR
jgi:peptide/nickel transport system permease protein